MFLSRRKWDLFPKRLLFHVQTLRSPRKSITARLQTIPSQYNIEMHIFFQIVDFIFRRKISGKNTHHHPAVAAISVAVAGQPRDAFGWPSGPAQFWQLDCAQGSCAGRPASQEVADRKWALGSGNKSKGRGGCRFPRKAIQEH